MRLAAWQYLEFLALLVAGAVHLAARYLLDITGLWVATTVVQLALVVHMLTWAVPLWRERRGRRAD